MPATSSPLPVVTALMPAGSARMAALNSSTDTTSSFSLTVT
ncbi:hypothetical protein [Cupriavidus sp. D39]|nr:hypothetical protein [Cupriavidus sp. D39]MCY0853125.1 hypothetical protein [Cupriavidus sp. D39]